MKTHSAKNKGRKLQQWFMHKLIELLGVDPVDVENRPMGSQGEDVILGKESRLLFPYSIECKNTERLNIWEAYTQAESHSNKYGGYEPLVVIKRNRMKPLVVLDAEYFIKLQRQVNDSR